MTSINPAGVVPPAISSVKTFDSSLTLTQRPRYLILAAAFLAWMFAGLELSMFVLVGRAAILDVAPGLIPKVVGQWFTWYQGAIMLGAAAGGFAFGWLGDRSGRTRAMAVAVLCYSVATGLCYFSRDLWLILALRFIVGMGIGGVWPNAVSLVAEAWPNASRPFLAGLLGTAANFGFVLIAVMALKWLVTPTTWRWVPAFGTLPLMLGIWMLTMVPESPKWLASRRKTANEPGAEPKANPLAEIFRGTLLRRTLIGITLGAIPVIGTSSNGNWLVFWSDDAADTAAKAKVSSMYAADDPAAATALTKARAEASRKKSMTQIQRSGGGIFGSLLGGWIASLVGRRLTYFLLSLFAFATSTFIFGCLHPDHAYFGLFAIILGFVGVTFFGWLPLYLPELFPTAVRSTGTGVSFNSGRIIAAIVVLGASGLIALFHEDFARVGLWTGSIYAVGMLVILFAPSTGGKKLED